jgi:hypothetical protein
MGFFNIFGKNNSEENLKDFENLKDTTGDKEVDFITNSSIGASMRKNNVIVSLGDVIAMPVETDDNRSTYYQFNNAKPQYYNELYKYSPIHSRIIKHIKDEIIKDYSFEYEQNVNNEIAFQKFITKTIKKNDDLDNFDDWLEDVIIDYLVQGNIFIEEKRNNNKAVCFEHKPAERYRILGDKNTLTRTGFGYNIDWLYTGQVYKLNNYDPNLGSGSHVIYIPNKQPDFKFYSEPDWVSAKKWIELDANVADFYNQHMINGVYPSAVMTFYEYPSAPEARRKFRDMLASIGGSNSRGKIISLLGKNPDLAPKIDTLKLNEMDKVFLQLADTIERQICYAYGLAPSIIGLKTPGSLGNTNADEIEFQTEKFNERLKNYKKTIVKLIQTMLDNSGNTQIKFKLK